MIFKKWDILIYVIIFTISGTILYSGISKKGVKAEYVEVHIDGKIKYKYKLSEKRKVVEIDVGNGKEEIEIEGMQVKKIKSTCKNKICEKQGRVSRSGESIICVPNKEIIKISGNSELDFIVK